MVLNQFKTAFLLALLAGIMLGIGSFWGQNGLLIALVIAVVFNLGAYFFSDKIVLRMYKANQIKKKDNEQLFDLVKEVSHKAQIPMPKVYVIQSSNPNAFATGRNPKNASVAFTTAILDLLDKNELKGVIAHEISHVKNRDILIATIAATIATVISYIAFMARFSAIFGIGGRDSNNNIVGLLIIGILTPIIAMLIQLAISRSREFLADETGGKLIGNPKALASALKKLHTGVKHHPMKKGSTSTASLFIMNPFSMKGMTAWLSTHPPYQERVKRLENM
ncbi:MAG: zinc metalloprotease HtpX [Nanoarchaeota archaeon]